MSRSTYLVRITGCPVGTETVLGTVTAVQRVSMDVLDVTFSTGEIKRFRWNQAIAVYAD